MQGLGEGLTWLGYWGSLHSVPCMTELLPKLTLRGAVFLMPLWLVGLWELLCDWVVSTSGSWKVTLLLVFLMLHGVEEVGMVRSSTLDVAARLETLNSKIPSLSEAT